MASGKICESDIKVKHLLEIKRLGNNTQAAPLVEKKLTSKNVTDDLGMKFRSLYTRICDLSLFQGKIQRATILSQKNGKAG